MIGCRLSEPCNDILCRFFLPVLIHEPAYGCPAVQSVFFPVRFCLPGVVTDGFTGFTQFWNIPIETADKQIFYLFVAWNRRRFSFYLQQLFVIILYGLIQETKRFYLHFLFSLVVCYGIQLNELCHTFQNL